jgi:putative thymidine phosphorylase
MKLKIKFLKWSAGFPIAMLNEKTAEKFGVYSKDRIIIKSLLGKKKKISTTIDLVKDLIKENEIAVSCELKEILKLKNGQEVLIEFSNPPKSIFYIRNKLNGKTLIKEEIFEITRDIVNNSLSEVEIALFISAMYKEGMNMEETINLIKAILKYGNKLSPKGKYIVDKHCIGGIAGNKTTPIVVSICSSAGLIFPKTSSRAITSEAGTVDFMETITKVDFNLKELNKILNKTGAFIIWGGGLNMVPADSKILRIEKILRIDPESQLLVSIMAKKIAVGSKYILIDIPYGKNAKVSKKKAIKLKKKFEYIAEYFNKKIKVILTKGNCPIGNGIGPILEFKDIINILDPKKIGPKDLEEKSLILAGHLFEMTGKTKKGNGIKKAREILYSGKAFKKFKEIVEAQGGSLEYKEKNVFKKNIYSEKKGKIKEILNKKIINLARISGCPFYKFSGVYLYFKKGNFVKKGDKILTIYSESKNHLKNAIKFYNLEKPIKIK